MIEDEEKTCELELYTKMYNNYLSIIHISEYCALNNIEQTTVNKRRARGKLKGHWMYVKGGYYYVIQRKRIAKSTKKPWVNPKLQQQTKE